VSRREVVYCGSCGLYGTPAPEEIPGLKSCGNCGAFDSLRFYHESTEEDCCQAQREADATIVEAAEPQVHALLIKGAKFSTAHLAYAICQLLTEQIRRLP